MKTYTEYQLRNGSTISDLEFLLAIFNLRRPTKGFPDWYEVSCFDLGDHFDIHWHRIQSKARRMYNRGLVDGFSNEYRFHITDKGERLLAEHGVDAYPLRSYVLEGDRGRFPLPFDRTQEVDAGMYRSFAEGLGEEASERNLEILISNSPDVILIRWRPYVV